MSDEKHYSQCKYAGTDDEPTPVCDHCLRVRKFRIIHICILGAKLPPVYDIEIKYSDHKCDYRYNACIRKEIKECESERCTNDDIRRISTHGGTSTQISTEYLGNDHWYRVK